VYLPVVIFSVVVLADLPVVIFSVGVLAGFESCLLILYVVTVGMGFLWQLYGIVVALFCCLHSLGGH
jgi:hypothetical protein